MKEYFSLKYSKKIEKALKTAAVLHFGQLRKNVEAVPFITHPFAVALIVSIYTDDENVVVAALLHDTIEDCKEKYSPEKLEEDFGKNVRDLVMGVTEQKNDERGEERPWKVRKEDYIKNLENANQETLLLCASDKIHNMSEYNREYSEHGPGFLKNFNCTREEKDWYNREILKVLERRLIKKDILEEYRRGLEETKR